MDNIFDFITSHVTLVMGLVIAVALAGASYSYIQYSDYENTADQVVSRSGGLTKPAYDILRNESKTRYHNMFTIRINDKQEYLKKPVAYGDYTTYEAVIKIKFLDKIIRGSGKRTVQNDVRVDE